MAILRWFLEKYISEYELDEEDNEKDNEEDNEKENEKDNNKEINKEDNSYEKYKERIAELEEQNKQLKIKNKKLSDERDKNKLIIYSSEDKLKRINIEKDSCMKENKELNIQINNLNDLLSFKEKEYTNLEKKYKEKLNDYQVLLDDNKQLKKQYDEMLRFYGKKNILIVGMKKELNVSEYVNISFKSEEMYQGEISIEALTDKCDEVWFILNEISSYNLRRKVQKESKHNEKIKVFNGPIELIEYVEENKKNGLL